ncbi:MULTISPECIES: hypothetical protein [unclassified Pseudomonas]|uniref:hypothetical protein n=1 Tax=unclassified Pseudomonas TaxID=196821 RepID=UPI00200FAF0C|nr:MULTISPECIES: hypothetical protein [unclassified Pseudomonas]
MIASNVSYLCPVCGYTGLEEAPYDELGCSSFGICPCCGTHFGYDDTTAAHADLRRSWVSSGMHWWSEAQASPSGWDPIRQLQAFEKDIQI